MVTVSPGGRPLCARARAALLVIATLLLTLGWSATPAHAGVQNGQTWPGPPTVSNPCGSDIAIFQRFEGTGISYRLSRYSIITSWWTRAGSAANQQAALRIFRDSYFTTDRFEVVGASAKQTLVPNRVNTFNVSIPVLKNDFVGLWGNANVNCAFVSSSDQNITRECTGSGCDKTSGSLYMPQQVPNLRVNVAVSAETDTDYDYLGDETQDNCPGTYNTSNLNSDGDAQGDLCDPDDDNDGVPDGSDPAPLDPSKPGASGGGGAGGGGTGGGTGAAADTAPPSLTGLSLKPAVFPAARTGSSFAKGRGGTRIRFLLSEAASVALTFERRARGRRVGSRCRKQTRTNARRARCVRWVKLRRLVQPSAAGPNTLPFTGRLAGRAMRAGRYRVAFVATDAAGNASGVLRRGFTVRRRR